MNHKEKILNAISKAVENRMPINEIDILIEIPPNPEMGDFAFPCFKLSSVLKKDAKMIARELKEKIVLPKEFSEIKVEGPYINFFLNPGVLAEEILGEILSEKEKYGSEKNKNQKILVEYCSPNTNKPLHLGHIRNIALGQSIINMYKFLGYNVTSTQIINDRGAHICKSMLAYKKFGEQKTPETENVKPDHFVGNFYVKYAKESENNPNFENEVKKMLQDWETGEKETIELWKKMNNWIYLGFEQTFEKLGAEFDKNYYESKIYSGGKELIDKGLEQGIFKKREDGAIIAELEDHGLPNKVVLRSDGTSIYITQDIYLAKLRLDEFSFDKLIYVIGSEQDLYMKQLFKILALLKIVPQEKLSHLSYGLVMLPEGKMKSREGKVVDADDIIAEMEELAKKELIQRYELDQKEVSKRSSTIGLAALKFHMLKNDAKKEILFDPKESISFEGETGPYLLYTYARCKSILKKKEPSQKNYSELKTNTEKNILVQLNNFNFAINDSVRQESPHILAQYLLKLAALFNHFYHEEPVLKAEPKLAEARLTLVKATAITLKNGLDLFGISVLDEM